MNWSRPLIVTAAIERRQREFFLDGMTQADGHVLPIRRTSTLPVTIYYAFKQSETKE